MFLFPFIFLLLLSVTTFCSDWHRNSRCRRITAIITHTALVCIASMKRMREKETQSTPTCVCVSGTRTLTQHRTRTFLANSSATFPSPIVVSRHGRRRKGDEEEEESVTAIEKSFIQSGSIRAFDAMRMNLVIFRISSAIHGNASLLTIKTLCV